jgi:DNA helicase-2/ATP-dependent DNA helicase PcrA
LVAAAGQRHLPLLRAAAEPDVLASLRPAAAIALADFTRLIAALRAAAAETGVDEILRTLTEAIRYGDYLRADGPDWSDRLDNVRELIASAAETVTDEGGEVGLTPLDHFLQRTALAATADQLDPNADAVAIMTLHNAKGLEFPVVFITGLEDGLFPLARACEDPDTLEEERRLLYVGITRAQRSLYLTHAEQRRRNGEPMPATESRFLSALPDAAVQRRDSVAVRSSGRAVLKPRSWRDTGLLSGTYRPSLRRPGTPVTFTTTAASPPHPDVTDASQDAPQYRVGERVRHRSFGTGTIAELGGAGYDAKVKIDFDDATIGRKTLVIAKAGLQPALE